MKYVRERDEVGEPDLQKFHKAAERVDKRDRVILKNEEEREVFEEVFDRKTLMILYDLSNKNAFAYLNGVISSGKEARVYWGVTKDNTDVAVKIYLVSSSDYKKRLQYVEGDPRFTKIRKDSRGVAELWARKEFINLKQAFDVGAPVPEPYVFQGKRRRYAVHWNGRHSRAAIDRRKSDGKRLHCDNKRDEINLQGSGTRALRSFGIQRHEAGQEGNPL